MKNKKYKQIIVITIIIFLGFFILKSFNNNISLTKKEQDWIRQQGTLVYAADKNSPPLRFADQADGQYKGILIDYINSLSLEIGAKIELHPMLWENALESLSTGQTDMCDMFSSVGRGKEYLFSKPIYNLRGVLALPLDSGDNSSLGDLDGQTFAIQKGDYASEYLEINFPNINQHYVDDLEEALLLIADGKVDGTIGDEPVIFFQLNNHSLKDKIKIIEKPVYENPVVFAIPKSKAELIPILNKGIEALDKKQVLERAQQKWFGISVPIVRSNSFNLLKKYIPIFIIIASGVVMLMAIWNYSLKEEINFRTQELEDSRNDLQIVFDGMAEFMIVLNKDNTVININTSFLNFINKNKAEVLGRSYKEGLGIFSTFNFNKILQDTIELGAQKNIEKYFNNEVYKIRSYPLIDTKDDVNNILVLIYNITNEKVNNEKLLQANKMIAIGELAAGIAHEIRNPLGIIRSHSFILRTSPYSNPTINKSLDYIDNAIRRSSKIVDNILNFSRISGDKEEPINISEFIHSLFELQGKTMEKQGISYEIECVKDYIILINQESLKHILINLISNSIDAIQENGKIIIKAYPYKNGIMIECIDTGVGINQEDLDRIFNPFYTTKEPGKGTGLGLYIVYNELKKLKGDISIESNLGLGSNFKLYLPTGGDL